jgi:hypothetical protein
MDLPQNLETLTYAQQLEVFNNLYQTIRGIYLQIEQIYDLHNSSPLVNSADDILQLQPDFERLYAYFSKYRYLINPQALGNDEGAHANPPLLTSQQFNEINDMYYMVQEIHDSAFGVSSSEYSDTDSGLMDSEGGGFVGRGYSKLSGKVGKCGMRKGACNCK